MAAGFDGAIELTFSIVAAANECANAAVGIEHGNGCLTGPEGNALFRQRLADNLVGATLKVGVQRRLDNDFGMAAIQQLRHALEDKIDGIFDAARVLLRFRLKENHAVFERFAFVFRRNHTGFKHLGEDDAAAGAGSAW